MISKTIADRMLALRQNYGKVLDPAAVNDGFSKYIDDCVVFSIEKNIKTGCESEFSFLSIPESSKFETIISDLPYLSYKDIPLSVKNTLSKDVLANKNNMYVYYIDKCIRHLPNGGELIAITSRNFLKASNSSNANKSLYENGTITHFFDLSDQRYFSGSNSPSAIWRFEKGDYRRKTITFGGEKSFKCSGGQLSFVGDEVGSVRLGDVFNVKVGAISGANEVFENEEFGNVDFVCSYTCKTGRTRKMIFVEDAPISFLNQFKSKLINRKGAKFTENNWWTWGRVESISSSPRIYVNERTRNKSPFFLNSCNRYDSSVLALFPIGDVNINNAVMALNKIDWESFGFIHSGRYIFSKKSLEELILPDNIYKDICAPC